MHDRMLARRRPSGDGIHAHTAGPPLSRSTLRAEVLAHRFHTTIMRAVHNLQLSVDDVPIQDVQFQSRR